MDKCASFPFLIVSVIPLLIMMMMMMIHLVQCFKSAIIFQPLGSELRTPLHIALTARKKTMASLALSLLLGPPAPPTPSLSKLNVIFAHRAFVDVFHVPGNSQVPRRLGKVFRSSTVAWNRCVCPLPSPVPSAGSSSSPKQAPSTLPARCLPRARKESRPKQRRLDILEGRCHCR